MRRVLLSFLFAILLGGLLIPIQRSFDSGSGSNSAPQPGKQPADNELLSKQAILEQDVQLTDSLCRTQCIKDFTTTLRNLQATDDAATLLALQEMKADHGHMDHLQWTSDNALIDTGILVGQIPDRIQIIASEYIEVAKQAIHDRKIYESPQIKHDDSQYFVLGVPAQDGRSGLIGLIHQDILHQVHIQQRKNLRIVPYPSDKRFKIKAVDSDNLRDVKVRDAEDNQGTSHYHDNQVVVKFKQQPTAAQLHTIQAEIKSTLMKKLGYTYVFESSHMNAKQLMSYFRKWEIEYVEPHYLYMTNENEMNLVVPNDELYSKYQWNLPAIDTTRGWQIARGSEKVIVAVIDTGVDLSHPDLKQRLVAGYNVIDDNDLPVDDVGHGTHVAGIISAIVNNDEGVAGMTWNNPVMPVKVLDETGAGSAYAVAQGIIWAADHGASVINMSLGNYAEANFLHDAIKYAFDKDIVLIGATGNDNTEQPGYPAAYPEVLAVAATDAHGKRASFSNYGDYTDVAAPGVSIASTYLNHQYAALSGTSMASPHAAALAALIRSANPLLKNTEVMDIMRQTTLDLGHKGKDKYLGHGQIDVVNALQVVEQGLHSLSLWPQWLERNVENIQSKFAE